MKQLFTALLLAAILPFSSSEDPCILTGGTGYDEQSDALKIVNDARAKLANGEQQNGQTGMNFPKGNIRNLTWSCDLEQQATDLLSGSCPPITAPTAPTGTTVFATFNYICPWYCLTSIMESHWFYDINTLKFEDTAFGNEDVTFVTSSSKELRAYANLVREDITEIGCTETVCNSKLSSLCLINGGELSLGDTVYHILGTTTTTAKTTTTATTTTTTTTTTTLPTTTTTTTTPATTTTTPAATTTAAANTTTEAATKGTTSCIPRRKATTMTASSTAPPQQLPELPPASEGPNERCPENTGMQDTLRTKFLDMHNYRRSQLAKGEVAKRNGNYLPQSSDMQRMRYNCALEKEVINYVSTCPSSESAESARPDVGENFIRVPQEGLATYLAAVEKAVTSWWKVIRTEEGPGLQVYFRQKHVGTSIESFTQMGWSTSRKLGCAIAKCGMDYVAVCRYSPRGNYVEQVIYKRGTPCTACAVGSWCTEDALCTLE